MYIPKELTEMIGEVDEVKIQELFERINASLYHTTGSRRHRNFSEAMYGIDHTRNSLYMPELEDHGFTFITRPKLNMTTSSIRQDRVLAMLDTLEPDTISFAIRASLDTSLTSKRYQVSNLDKSPFFNQANPFFPVLTNRLLTMNGWPDWTLEVETTEGGFFSESITYPKGHDQLTRNYDIQASFGDIQGSPILILFTMWFRYIHLLTRGLITSYMEDIEDRRMGFTSSIYRFVMDPSRRYILKWGKATGCFPRNVPLGAYFNYDSNASNVESAMNVAIPFTVAGRVEYYDPIILQEFNMVVERRCPGIENWKVAHDNLRLLLNYRCVPYINLTKGSNELEWRYNPKDPVVQAILKTAGLLFQDDSPVDEATGESENHELFDEANQIWT